MSSWSKLYELPPVTVLSPLLSSIVPHDRGDPGDWAYELTKGVL